MGKEEVVSSTMLANTKVRANCTRAVRQFTHPPCGVVRAVAIHRTTRQSQPRSLSKWVVARAAQSEEVVTETEAAREQAPPSNGPGPKEGGRIPEDRDWPEMRNALLEFGLESIA